MRLALFPLSTLVCALCWPVTASAYCRTTTEKQTEDHIDAGVCPDGLPAFWDDLEIHYGFDPSRPFGDLDHDDVREVYAQAFAAWQAVECEGGAPGFTFIEDTEPYSEPEPRHVLGEANVNVMLWRPAEEWTIEDGYEPNAFAITTVWFDKNSGRMLGADMELNEAIGPWVRCPDSGCTSANVTDLANVITHEVGHVLALGESYEGDATMFWWGEQGQINKRDLTADDVAGLCEGHSPSAQREREGKEEDRCAVGWSGEPTAATWALGLVALALARRRVRPRRP
jgi:hypothetical protein